MPTLQSLQNISNQRPEPIFVNNVKLPMNGTNQNAQTAGQLRKFITEICQENLMKQ